MLMLTAPLKRITDINEHAAERAGGRRKRVPADRRGRRSPITARSPSGRARGEIRLRERELALRQGSERPALDGIDLAIAPGETVALVGASGARQDHARQPGAALLPADARAHPARRPRPAGADARQPARQHRAGQPGRGAVQRHGGGQHRLRGDERRARRRTSSPPPRPRTRWNSSARCRRGSPPSSARTA